MKTSSFVIVNENNSVLIVNENKKEIVSIFYLVLNHWLIVKKL